jgi:hypothetical protein
MVRGFLCSAAVIGAVAFAGAVQSQGRPQIVLFQEDNYRGNQLVIDRDTANLTDFHFNDRVSSVRVMGGVWRLCEHDYGRGRCVTVSRDEPKMGRLGMDDNITSVLLDGGRGRDRDRDDRRRRGGRDRDWDGR